MHSYTCLYEAQKERKKRDGVWIITDEGNINISPNTGTELDHSESQEQRHSGSRGTKSPHFPTFRPFVMVLVGSALGYKEIRCVSGLGGCATQRGQPRYLINNANTAKERSD